MKNLSSLLGPSFLQGSIPWSHHCRAHIYCPQQSFWPPLWKLLHKLLHLLAASITCAQTHLSVKPHSLILTLHILGSQVGRVLSNAEVFIFTIMQCLHHIFQNIIMNSNDKVITTPPPKQIIKYILYITADHVIYAEFQGRLCHI